MAFFEPWQSAANEVDQAMNMLTALDFSPGQVFDLLPVQPRHVRAVAPDHAWDGCLEPPKPPGSTQKLLDLSIQCGVGLGLLSLVALSGLGVHVTQAKDRGHDVVAAGMRCACRGGNIEVASGINDHLAQDGLRPALAFADHAANFAVFNQGVREPGVQPQLNAGLSNHVQ